MNKKRIILILILVFLIMLFELSFISAAQLSQKRISVNLNRVELERALIILADLGGVNLISDKSVSGNVTAIFDEVKFVDALDLLTQSFDLSYSKTDKTIFVSSRENIEAQQREITQEKYLLKHINSEKAIEHLEKAFKEINFINLESGGILVEADLKEQQAVKELLLELDQPQKQVLIKARIEEISRNKVKELGINPDQLSELSFIKDDSGSIEKLRLSWPDTLRILAEEGASNILANPSLMTLDRKKAKLVIGDQIPVKLERVEGDNIVSSLSYIEAGIVLEFLPKIINDDQILLQIKPSVNSIGQVVADGLPAVNSRSAETTVILENEQVLAIGGLIKEDEINSLSKVPFFSELPLLGNLFRSEKNMLMNSELVIFISPKIIYSGKEEKIAKKQEFDKNMQELSDSKENYKNREFIQLTSEEIREILNN
ncbi:type II and III secretion system protein [Halanaerobium sp. Z-7514]|uniref:Type II and III secretion system protein n=1 Tax=Halanaerobium polyolivorans TaxID=2886943 RepID=A0AAW4WRL9_9FIRM|nr:type II and III secretion system protein [Halanaerobium polyolivorans]MCC3143758.1 type II and III secretion system protein [Halanaerobium polyolivorans]